MKRAMDFVHGWIPIGGGRRVYGETKEVVSVMWWTWKRLALCMLVLASLPFLFPVLFLSLFVGLMFSMPLLCGVAAYLVVFRGFSLPWNLTKLAFPKLLPARRTSHTRVLVRQDEGQEGRASVEYQGREIPNELVLSEAGVEGIKPAQEVLESEDEAEETDRESGLPKVSGVGYPIEEQPGRQLPIAVEVPITSIFSGEDNTDDVVGSSVKMDSGELSDNDVESKTVKGSEIRPDGDELEAEVVAKGEFVEDDVPAQESEGISVGQNLPEERMQIDPFSESVLLSGLNQRHIVDDQTGEDIAKVQRTSEGISRVPQSESHGRVDGASLELESAPAYHSFTDGFYTEDSGTQEETKRDPFVEAETSKEQGPVREGLVSGPLHVAEVPRLSQEARLEAGQTGADGEGESLPSGAAFVRADEVPPEVAQKQSFTLGEQPEKGLTSEAPARGEFVEDDVPARGSEGISVGQNLPKERRQIDPFSESVLLSGLNQRHIVDDQTGEDIAKVQRTSEGISRVPQSESHGRVDGASLELESAPAYHSFTDGFYTEDSGTQEETKRDPFVEAETSKEQGPVREGLVSGPLHVAEVPRLSQEARLEAGQTGADGEGESLSSGAAFVRGADEVPPEVAQKQSFTLGEQPEKGLTSEAPAGGEFVEDDVPAPESEGISVGQNLPKERMQTDPFFESVLLSGLSQRHIVDDQTGEDIAKVQRTSEGISRVPQSESHGRVDGASLELESAPAYHSFTDGFHTGDSGTQEETKREPFVEAETSKEQGPVREGLVSGPLHVAEVPRLSQEAPLDARQTGVDAEGESLPSGAAFVRGADEVPLEVAQKHQEPIPSMEPANSDSSLRYDLPPFDHPRRLSFSRTGDEVKDVDPETHPATGQLKGSRHDEDKHVITNTRDFEPETDLAIGQIKGPMPGGEKSVISNTEDVEPETHVATGQIKGPRPEETSVLTNTSSEYAWPSESSERSFDVMSTGGNVHRESLPEKASSIPLELQTHAQADSESGPSSEFADDWQTRRERWEAESRPGGLLQSAPNMEPYSFEARSMCNPLFEFSTPSPLHRTSSTGISKDFTFTSSSNFSQSLKRHSAPEYRYSRPSLSDSAVSPPHHRFREFKKGRYREWSGHDDLGTSFTPGFPARSYSASWSESLEPYEGEFEGLLQYWRERDMATPSPTSLQKYTSVTSPAVLAGLLREEINTIQRIVGQDIEPQHSLWKDVESLSELVGMELPYMGDVSDLMKARQGLDLLKVVVGIKWDVEQDEYNK